MVPRNARGGGSQDWYNPVVSDGASVGRLRQWVRYLRWAVRESRQWEIPRRYVWFALLHRWGWHERVVFSYAGARFRLFCSPMTLLMYYHPHRWHGAEDLRRLVLLARPGDVMVDVGANVGSHIIPLLRRLGRASQGYAFEPHPRVFRYLQANARLNRLETLRLYNYALGTEEGEVAFTDASSDDLNRVAQEDAPLRVPLRPLDCFECARQPITLLKIDVEGYELFVLRGAEQALANTQLLYIEACDAHTARYGYTVCELADYLRQRGWLLYRWSEPDRLTPVPAQPQVEQWENWLGVRDRAFLQERLCASPFLVSDE